MLNERNARVHRLPPPRFAALTNKQATARAVVYARWRAAVEVSRLRDAVQSGAESPQNTAKKHLSHTRARARRVTSSLNRLRFGGVDGRFGNGNISRYDKACTPPRPRLYVTSLTHGPACALRRGARSTRAMDAQPPSARARAAGAHRAAL